MIQKLITSFIALFLITQNLFARTITTSIPFQNIEQAPNTVIFANYNFESHAMIFCYENNQQSIGQVIWTYQGIPQFSTLSILLKVDGQFEGEFADPIGTITVNNNTTSSFITNCVFGY